MFLAGCLIPVLRQWCETEYGQLLHKLAPRP
ncbi:hypothetical protein Q604_UNBC01418G0001, partial [human gut metagenome]